MFNSCKHNKATLRYIQARIYRITLKATSSDFHEKYPCPRNTAQTFGKKKNIYIYIINQKFELCSEDCVEVKSNKTIK